MKLDSFAGIRLLEWFLAHPSRRIYFKELCRETELGPVTVKGYCEDFIIRQWLLDERVANARFFFLNNANYVVKALKKAYILEFLKKKGMESIADSTAISFALYGSYASGEYDERSDIDFLIIGRKESVDYKVVEKLRKDLEKEVQITIIPLEKWERNKKTDPFISSVLKNHVLIRGAPL